MNSCDAGNKISAVPNIIFKEKEENLLRIVYNICRRFYNAEKSVPGYAGLAQCCGE